MSIIPEPTVFATPTPNTKAATKLKNAAHATAWPGESTRVETTVAIEFAASWKPFRKSKTSAVKTIPATARNVTEICSMHLGYHIYALSTQSPDIEATKPLLYSTVFVLLVLTFLLNLTAIIIRNRMRQWTSK